MHKYLKSTIDYFTTGEKILWCTSVTLIAAAFLIFDRGNYLTLAASLLGVTSLIYNAKGNPFGQILMILFSLLYGVISFQFCYYGEMITYLGMTAPMSVFALISWLRNPYQGDKSQVAVSRLEGRSAVFMLVLAGIVTLLFYFVLKAFHTAHLIPSTVSVTTSFLAVYLTYKRSALFALAYAANDMVLIILWILAAISDISCLSVIMCFVMFLCNDIYTFINWRRMYRCQQR